MQLDSLERDFNRLTAVAEDLPCFSREVAAELNAALAEAMATFNAGEMCIRDSFLLSPADILSGMVPSVPHTVWVWLILAYYFVATLLPIDKIIGKIYPIFGVALILMALALLGVLLFGQMCIRDRSGTGRNDRSGPQRTERNALRRRRLRAHAALAGLSDPVAQHRRYGSDLRRDSGSSVRSRGFSVDHAGRHLHGCDARLPVGRHARAQRCV